MSQSTTISNDMVVFINNYDTEDSVVKLNGNLGVIVECIREGYLYDVNVNGKKYVMSKSDFMLIKQE